MAEGNGAAPPALGQSVLAAGDAGQKLALAQDAPPAEPITEEGQQQAAAQPADPAAPRSEDGLLDADIVVTAQRREQNLQDVGVSVTAFSGEQIEKLGFRSAGDVAAQSPNVLVRRHFPARGLLTNFFVRGVGQTDFNNATEGSVAAYVDDFYMSSSSTVDFLLFDMARAEVLRGPQGTLFGRNATGGAFQYFTNRPSTDEFEGRIRVGYGSFDRRLADGFVNVPLGERAALRFSGTLDKFDSTADNLFPGKDVQGDGNFHALRGQLLIEPADDFTLLFKAETGRAKGHMPGDHGQAYDLLDTLEGRGEVIPVDTDGFGYTAPDDGPNKFSTNGLNYADNRVRHLSGRIEKKFAFATLTSITGYLSQHLEMAEDCDGTPTPFCNYQPDYHFREFTQEIRLSGDSGPLNWSVGGFYMRQKSRADIATPILVGMVPATDPTKLGALSLLIDNHQKLISKAVFGQLEYKIVPQVTLIGGLRYTNDTKDFEQILRLATVDYNTATPNFDSFDEMRDFVITGDAAPPNVFTREVAGDLTHLDEKNVGATAQVNWEPNKDTLLYLSYRRGIKGGGFNNEIMPVRLPATKIPYKNEVLTAYELGWKLSPGDVLARVNGAVFYYDYKDYQAVSFQDFGIFQQNADATLYGGEIEVVLNPAEGLELLAGGAYLHSKIKNIQRQGGFILTSAEMGEAPKFTANGLARYTTPVAALGGDMSFQFDGNYTGERFVDVLNQEGLKLPAYTIFNTLVSYEHSSGRWALDFWVKNLFDKRVATFKLQADDLIGSKTGQINYNVRRWAGVEATLRF